MFAMFCAKKIVTIPNWKTDSQYKTGVQVKKYLLSFLYSSLYITLRIKCLPCLVPQKNCYYIKMITLTRKYRESIFLALAKIKNRKL